MKLTDTRIKAFKPLDKLHRELDGKGLYIAIKPNGSRVWEFRYTFNSKPNWLGFGVYPVVTLKQARAIAEEYRTLIASGINPKAYKDRQKNKDDNTLGGVAAKWLDIKKTEVSSRHYSGTIGSFKKHILPIFGKRDIDKITAPEIVRFLKTFEAKGHLKQRDKVKSHLNQIFAYAIADGLCEINPVCGINPVLKTAKSKRFDAVTKPEDIAQLLRDIDNYHGFYTTVMALKLAPYVMLRPSELAALEWEEFSEEKNQLEIKPERMKMRKAHVVPLSKKALAIMKELKEVTGNGQYVFKSPKKPSAPISTNALRLALRSLGHTGKDGGKPKHDTHGFRHMASTRLYEMASMCGLHSDMIELQLAHTQTNKVKAIYNQAEYIEERARMMQVWADYLDNLKLGDNVTNLADHKAVS